MEPWKASDLAEAAGGRLIAGNGECLVTSVAIDSRKVREGSLFVPIVGENVDAHQFIGKAFEEGAAAVFTERDGTEIGSGKEGACIRVEDTKEALKRFGAAYRSRFSLPIVGITGSVGKTTTKDMVTAALSSERNVISTEKNMNSQIGVPVMMTRIERAHEAAVIEMGMSETGEMSRLARIVRPDMAVITNIGVSHIGQLGSKENIRREKLHIIDCFDGTGTLILNGDDPMLRELFDRKGEFGLEGLRILTYGWSAKCDFHAEQVRREGETTRFLCAGPEGTQEIRLQTLGDHNIVNALAAVAAAGELGISAASAAAGLSKYRPDSMRGKIKEKNGVKILDDTYNASPDSVRSAVNTLLQLKNPGRRVAVLADIKELGTESRKYHYEIGSFLARTVLDGARVTEVITIGEEAGAIREAVEAENPSIKTRSFSSNPDAAAYLEKELRSGDAVLVKGSRGMHTDEITKALLS